MRNKSIPKINKNQIDAVLKYLYYFEQPNYQFGNMVTEKGHIPYCSLSSEVCEFIKVLYDQKIIFSFDWVQWKQDASHYENNPSVLEKANLLTIRKLLTTHVQADRFVEGHLLSVMENGHITAILRRLKQIREEID